MEKYHYLCFVRQNGSGYVHVGVAEDPVAYLKFLQEGNPHLLEIAFVVKSNNLAVVQRVFEQVHQKYEITSTKEGWYLMSDAQLKQLAERLKEVAGVPYGGYRHGKTTAFLDSIRDSLHIAEWDGLTGDNK